MALPGDETMSGLDKYKVGEIAVCAHKGLDLAAEQIVIAKDRIAKGMNSPVVVFQIHNLLEGKE
jgi:hypothetical protein